MVRKKRLALKLLSVAVACLVGAGFLIRNNPGASAFSESASASAISQYNGSIDTNRDDYFDSNVIYQLPDTVAASQDISVIVTMNADTVLDKYNAAKTDLTLAEYMDTNAGSAALRSIERRRVSLIGELNKSGISYELGETYDTILSGFEITLKAKDFEALQDVVGSSATLIVGDEYAVADTQAVENDVNVYSTGIFDSSGSEYQGNGVVIAVLDTGLDYTHTAFSVDNFTTPDSDLAFTLGDGSSKDIAAKVGNTVASTFTAGLTGEDVYVSKKVPYAYDYADKDADVFPINSEHGTHVAGIIAGKDDVITGVAPNAQLAIMKVFSDTADGAKTSWILAALEDCVILGVDVINMSLGSACGFSREVDKETTNEIYDKIKEAGISLIVAASNSYNSTYGSEKNGNLGLTSNPDSGTVGSPATYDAALAVASISGEKTPYMLLGDEVIYFNEATDKSAKSKNFVDEILSASENSKTFEYIIIGGYGNAVDYIGVDVQGKIALVKRGTTTFEDKIKAATDAGAAGIIIYNNVSGTISMSIGSATAPACSISQDDGEMLVSAAQKAGGVGKITISRDQLAGPFISDFSSWGPTSDLKIKPEITAHGGNILSAVPGQGYDKLSGTSMAAPNQSGVTALIRQYVKEHIASDASQVTALVNQIMMSTADIAYNKNGLPYAVRKQGAGLANLNNATMTPAYLTTFENGQIMDKTKLELGDDRSKSGVYTMTFAINNISSSTLTYNVDAIVMTEGVSSTYTSHGETTVTEEGYLLSGARREVTKVTGGTAVGNVVTVNAKGTATVTLTVTLSAEDKQYLDESFENGMYVEGFVTLTAQGNNNIDLNIPFLAFYGDWTQAPIFDEEYFDTNPDELDAGIDEADKVMADATSTRVIGGLYSDYIAYLGSYYFVQDPSLTQIAASKEHIALSNQNNGSSGNTTINSLSSIWAGLLRNVKRAYITIVEDSTGEVVFYKEIYNQRKSYSSGSTIYYSTIDIDFSAIEYSLKNNTKYTVTVDTYIDYGTDESQNNTRNTLEFPLYIDFEAPVITDVAYRTVYDKINKTTKLYADLSVYDNHYAMAVQTGQIVESTNPDYTYSLETFGKYITPIYSSYNSTSLVTIELTDYINDIKNSVGNIYNADGTSTMELNNNSFIAIVYDYALNEAYYEIRLPDSIVSMFFDVTADAKKDVLNQNQINAGNIGADDQVLVLSPNETFDLSTILQIYPSESWVTTLNYSVSDENIIGVVNGRIVARNSGTATVTVTGNNGSGGKISTDLDVVVLTSDDKDLGYVKYDPVAANKFEVAGYTTDFAFYLISNSERDIGLTGGTYVFGSSLSLSMYPGEQVTLNYVLNSYFPDRTSVTFSSSREDVATVDENGTITALYTANRDASAQIAVTLLLDGKKSTSIRIDVTVKTPFITNSIYFMYYRGGGDADGVVEIPDDLGITTIYSYAFSGYEYVEKDLDAGDVIDDEDPYYIKQSYLGNDKIKKIIIPEGVTEIMSYAFANLTALEEVVLPSTLTKIGVGAFYNCTSLKTVNFENVKFINKQAFYNTAIQNADFASIVSFGEYAFQSSKIINLNLPESCQSIGLGAFYNCVNLASVEFNASKVKIGSYAFCGCTMLAAININAAVISSYAFYGCSSLGNVTLGADVSVIGEFAFSGTAVSAFNISASNAALSTKNGNNAIVYKGGQLLLVAPAYTGSSVTTDATSIATGAFSSNKYIKAVIANNATSVGDYAFANCTSLTSLTMGNLVSVGSYAFFNTSITALPNAANITSVGNYAFAATKLVTIKIADNAEIGDYAFYGCTSLRKLELGDDVTLGEGAFASTALTAVTAGVNLAVGDRAFYGLTSLSSVTLGTGAIIGDYAFFNATALTGIDLKNVVSIGDYAFAATSLTDVDLSDVTHLGEGAFYYCTSLTSVNLGEKITEISVGAFYGCSSLVSINLGEQIKTVGGYAFLYSSLANVNLENVLVIGEYAFAGTYVTEIELGEGVYIGDYAFYYATNLTDINLDKVIYIGAGAFEKCSFTYADLSSATYIGDFAFAYSALTEVSFGVELDSNGNVTKYSNLEAVQSPIFLSAMGENPFLGCAIETFGIEAEVIFNGKVIDTLFVDTYAISGSVEVINGAIYQTVPNGLELVSFPMASSATTYTIEEGTVRISAAAFAGSSLRDVTIASTVAAIGDKAFYGCEDLRLVVFKSYNAPILEEEYDESYLNTIPLPFEGYFTLSYTDGSKVIAEGLGISKYYMWNIMYYYNDFYYGANFVNYVGRVSDKLTVVRPVNGKNYDTFIMSQYFGTVVEGSTAADSTTIAAIAAIAAIPANVVLTEECEALVNAARAAYDLIGTNDQRALVTNVGTLTSAEITIEYLKSLQETPGQTETPAAAKDNAALIIGLSVGAGVIVIAAAAVVTIILIKKRKNVGKSSD